MIVLEDLGFRTQPLATSAKIVDIFQCAREILQDFMPSSGVMKIEINDHIIVPGCSRLRSNVKHFEQSYTGHSASCFEDLRTGENMPQRLGGNIRKECR